MMGVNDNLNVCHKCCSVSSFKGIVKKGNILMDNDCSFFLQNPVTWLVHAPHQMVYNSVEICDAIANANSLLRFFVANPHGLCNLDLGMWNIKLWQITQMAKM
jgi:hypothetical protein